MHIRLTATGSIARSIRDFSIGQGTPEHRIKFARPYHMAKRGGDLLGRDVQSG